MHKELRDDKLVTVFDDVEEMKWFYHRKLCKNSSDTVAGLIVGVLDVNRANELLRLFKEPCEVKK